MENNVLMTFSFLPKLLSLLICFAVCALLAAVCVYAKLRGLLDRVPERDAALDEMARTTPARLQDSRLAASLAACAALSAFLWIPLGSLPSLLPLSWGGTALGGLASLACLLLALGFEEAWNWNDAVRRNARALAFLGLSLALFAWHVRGQDLFGEPFSLDSYVTMPLAGFMGWQGRLGMMLLALAVLLALRDVQQDLACRLARIRRLEALEARAVVASALTRQIWIFAALGIALCLFVPFCPAGLIGMSGITGIVTDALFFCLKVLLADHALWLAGTAFPRLFTRVRWTQVLIAALGALAVLYA
jgi:hypothetical protein